MRSTSLAGQNRKMLPVLLGIFVFNPLDLAQDLPSAKPESGRVILYQAIND